MQNLCWKWGMTLDTITNHVPTPVSVLESVTLNLFSAYFIVMIKSAEIFRRHASFLTNKPYMNSFKSLNSRRKIGIWVILFWPDCLWHCDTPPRHAGQDSCLLFAGKCCSGCWFLLLSSLSGSDLAYRNPSQAPRPAPPRDTIMARPPGHLVTKHLTPSFHLNSLCWQQTRSG